MKAIYDIKSDMYRMKKVMEFIEEYTKGKDFTVADLRKTDKSYLISGSLMKALQRRGLIEKVGECPSSFKKEMYVDARIGYAEVTVPTTVKIYRQIHDFEWYQNVMLKTLTNAVMDI